MIKKRTVKVWLDDVRPMPKEFDIHVKTYDEAIAVMAQLRVLWSRLIGLFTALIP